MSCRCLCPECSINEAWSSGCSASASLYATVTAVWRQPASPPSASAAAATAAGAASIVTGAGGRPPAVLRANQVCGRGVRWWKRSSSSYTMSSSTYLVLVSCVPLTVLHLQIHDEIFNFEISVASLGDEEAGAAPADTTLMIVYIIFVDECRRTLDN